MTGAARELRLLDLLRALEEARVDFIVFGAVALSFHGYVRATSDLDIVVDPNPDNLERLTRWLEADRAVLSLDPSRSVDGAAIRAGANATVLTSLGALDVIQRLPGLPPWNTLRARAGRFELDDLTLLVVDRETLVARKRARATHQDLADVERLEG
jgi:hypothetical protein